MSTGMHEFASSSEEGEAVGEAVGTVFTPTCEGGRTLESPEFRPTSSPEGGEAAGVTVLESFDSLGEGFLSNGGEGEASFGVESLVEGSVGS